MTSAMVEGWIRLSLAPDIGPKIAHQLLAQFGSPEAIFAAERSRLLAVGVMGEKRVESLLNRAARDEALKEIQRAAKHGIDLIAIDDERYPENLRALSHPPLVLYVQGELRPEDRIALAVVGPRHPSQYARIMANTLIPPLCARGITIVSGLAAGVDAESHLAAIDSGGRTIAVLGHGLDVSIYPSTNRALATRILRENLGAIVSVFPLGTKPEAGNFPHRNEIIAGISLGALIIEAGEKSGALITAAHSAELGRAVMACPGDATRANSRGSNRLIGEGAGLVQCSDDVLHCVGGELRRARMEMGMDEESETSETGGSPAAGPAQPKSRPTGELEGLIWDMLEAEHRPIDWILNECAASGFNQSEVVHKLLLMEMGGLVQQLPGRVFMLAP